MSKVAARAAAGFSGSDAGAAGGALDRWGSPAVRTLVPAALAAGAILLFHPGAMEMDRIKWSFLLFASLLPVAMLLRGALVRTARAPLSPGLAAAALMLAFLLLSCFRTGLPPIESFRLFAGILVLITLAAVVRDGAWRRPRRPAAVLLTAAAIAALYGVAQTAGFEPFYAEDPGRQAVSTLGNTNAAAEVFAILLPVAAAGAFSRRRRYLVLSLLALPALAAGLYATGSRGGLLAALVGLGVFALLAHRSRTLKSFDGSPSFFRRRAPRTAAALALIAVAALIAAGVEDHPGTAPFKNIDTSASVFSPEYPTNKVRLSLWKSTLAMIADHPLLGAGPGRFQLEYPRYRDPEEARIRGLLGAQTEVESPHNEILWAAAEGGIGAAASLGLALLLFFLHSAAASGRSREPERALQAAGLAGLFAAFGVLCLVRSPIHNPASACILFIAAGIADAMRYEAGTLSESGPARAFAAAAGAAAILALTCFGGRALLADVLFADVGTASEFGQDEYKQLELAMAADDGDIALVNFTGQMAAQIARARNDWNGPYAADAKRLLSEVLRRHPLHPGALKTLAAIRLREGDTAAGMRMLKKALQLTGSTEDAAAAAAAIVEDAGLYRHAAELLLEGAGGAARAMERAQAHLDAGNFQTAALYADMVLARAPLEVNALHLKARSLRELEGANSDAAFGLMQAVISLEWIEKGGYEAAEKSARRSLRYAAAAAAESVETASAADPNGAALLLAVAEAAQGRPFAPPAEPIAIPALAERLRRLAGDERLPAEVRAFLERL